MQESKNKEENKSPVIDVRALYVRFLQLNGIHRQGCTTLEDAVSHLFGSPAAGDRLFLPHRAMEDVIATVFVLAAVLDLGGVV
jgi:hypothetical protein